ncbi:hypothetical protein AAF143_11965 [Cyanobium sp. ATX-6F1]
MAGTADQAEELAALGNVDPALTIALGQCLREGEAPTGDRCCSACAACSQVCGPAPRTRSPAGPPRP